MASIVNTATNTAIGMMDPAYFVGRNEILNWLNDLLKLNISKIEETANGAVACQVLDSLFPGVVPMSKINWGAKNDYEFVQNYKVLQSVCSKLKIDRKIEVERLTRGRYQDNLEFMQWLKKFFEINCNDSISDYDAVGRRKRGKNVSQYKPCAGQAKVLPTANAGGTATRRTSAPKAKPSQRQRKISEPREKENSAKNTPVVASSSEDLEALMNAQNEIVSLKTELENLKVENTRLIGEVAGHTQRSAVLVNDVEGLTKERDFYFGKLHEVELLLQDYTGPDSATKDQILKILYEGGDADVEDDLAAEEDLVDVGPEVAEEMQEEESLDEGKDDESKQELTARQEEKLSDEQEEEQTELE